MALSLDESRTLTSLASTNSIGRILKKTMEDRFIMKNYILTTALAMLTGTIVVSPLNSRAQSTSAQNTGQQTAAQPDPKQDEFIISWHDICYKQKDEERCYRLSKELIDKYPNANKDYIKFAMRNVSFYERNKNIDKFNKAFDEYLKSPQDPNKIEAFFTTSDEYLEFDRDPQSPTHLFAVGQVAVAGYRTVLSDVYKNPERVKVYAERALKEFEAIPPEKFNDKEFTRNVTPLLRDLVLANSSQYLGYYLFQAGTDNPEAEDRLIAYIEKSIRVKDPEYKDFGWKEPNNYYMRMSIYIERYSELRKKYDSLTDEQKTGDAGKELLNQINQLLDTKLIPESARLIATATNPQFKDIKNGATENFNNFWKFRVDDPAKAAAYLKSFEADPTVEGPPVPVKADDSTGAPAPNAISGAPKLTPGTMAVPGTGTGKTPTKGRTPPRRKGSHRR
jgi:hypothetical protein